MLVITLHLLAAQQQTSTFRSQKCSSFRSKAGVEWNELILNFSKKWKRLKISKNERMFEKRSFTSFLV